MKFTRLALITLVFTAFSAHAGLLEDLESPVTTNAKWILLGGTGLTLAVIATQDRLSGPWETQVAKNRPLGKSSEWGDRLGQLLPNMVYTGAMGLAAWAGAAGAGAHAWNMVEVTAYAGLVTLVLKTMAGEGRPYDQIRGSSFPSGHSSTAFAFAGVVAAEHGWLYGTPAMLMAAFVGYSRINDNAHRLHDVIAGATIGLTCAYGIHFAHRAARESGVTLLPAPLPDGGPGAIAQWNF